MTVEMDPEKLVHFTFTPSEANDLLSAPANPGTRRISL